MKIIREMKEFFIKQIFELVPEPNPAYNTVSTIVRILETKGFVSHKAFGNTHQYFPLVQKTEYRKFLADKIMGSYFNGSVKSLVSFFVQQETLDLKEANEIFGLIEKSKKS